MQQWRLQTQTTEYVVSLMPDGSGLALDYWGERSRADIGGAIVRKPHFQYVDDVAPLEYASTGQRHATFAELRIDRGDAYLGARWQVDERAIEFVQDDRGSRLGVPFTDETGTIRLTLRTSTDTGHDIVRRSARIENLGDTPILLPRVFSAGWNVLPSRSVRLDYLAGRWAQETQRRSTALQWGTFSMGSRQGITSHSFAPTVTVTPLPDEDSPAAIPEGSWGIALEWSGSWRLQVDSDPAGQRGVRVSCGIDDDLTTVTLAAGEHFETPDSVAVFSPGGPTGVTRAWHRYQRLRLVRDLGPVARPVVYNSWYATTFDVRLDHQLAIAERAKALGVETFVVDDGWFRGRVSDTAGLGDWTADPAKFPNGLGELADRIHDLGMGFGLWIEPEMVNPDSDLYRAHPDWVYRAGDRPLVQSRNQYVLDLGLPQVEEWVAQTLRDLLGSTRITYLKWDMNRTVSDGGRPGDQHGREWSVQHTRAYYRLMRLIRDEFPHVVVEACAGGGGRIDHRVLSLSDVVWPSDEVGPRDRLVIQHGFLSAYPASAMLSFVSDLQGFRDQRPASLAFRFAVAMTGVLAIGSDVLRWDDDEVAEATRLVARYKELRDVIHRGDPVIHGSPGDDLYSIEYRVSGEQGPIVLFVFDTSRDRSDFWTATMARVFPTTLDRERRYRVEGTELVIDRESALRTGIEVPFALAPDTDLIVLTPLE